MAHDDLAALGGNAQVLDGAAGHIAVRGAVEAVAADAQLIVILLRHAVHEGLRRHGLMEGGVEHGHHGGVRHDGLAGLNAHQVGRVVQRAQRDVLLDGRDHLVGDQAGGGKLLAAVQHAVTHGADLVDGLNHAVLRIHQRLQHHAHGGGVVGQRSGQLKLLLVAVLVGQLAALDADALHQTLGDDGAVVHVDQLVLQGRRTGVDNQNFHGNLLQKQIIKIQTPGGLEGRSPPKYNRIYRLCR